ncbi:MAG: response regulator transcription factor [Ignavibacteriaceae bacterium]
MIFNVLIADDHSFIREGLKNVLSRELDLKVIGEARNSVEVLEHLKNNKTDVLLLDISMPGRSGIDIIKDIKNLYPDVKILMLSMHPEDTFAIRSLKLGASGYLTKDSAPDELVKAIRKVISGGNYVSITLAEKLAGHLKQGMDKLPHENLSDREFEVLRLIAGGKTVSGIAVELNLSVQTVSTYRARILEKMNMKSNAELTYYAVANNLIS